MAASLHAVLQRSALHFCGSLPAVAIVTAAPLYDLKSAAYAEHIQIDLQTCSPAAQTGAAAGPGDARGFSPDQYTDIRYDEEYEKFYRQSVANGVKLPPPVDSTTLYSQLPQYSQQHAPRPPGNMLGPQPSYGVALRLCPLSSIGCLDGLL